MRTPLLIACLLLLGIAAPAAAEVPSTMTFQGVLTDDAGTLFPDGNYDLTFNIYSVASGGSALYSEAHPSVALVRGGFSVILGSTTPLTLPFDVPYWLGIQVGGGAELSPRVPLTSSPYALSLRLPFSGTGGDLTTPTLSLNNNVLGGDALKAKQQVTVEAGNGLDFMQVMSSENSAERYNGITLDDPEVLAELVSRVQADGTRSSHLSLHRHTGDGVVIFSGTWNGAPVLPPKIDLYDGSIDVHIATDDVTLPASSIGAGEIADEPGVTASGSSGSVNVGASYTTLRSTTINCPAAGYVLVMGTCEATFTHVTGTNSTGNFGVSTTSTSFPANGDMGCLLPAALPTSFYVLPLSMHGVFPVSAGAHTFYLLGIQSSGTCLVQDMQLTAVFLPTTYGTVSSTMVADGGEESAVTSPGPGLTASDVAAERDASIRANQARVEKELADIKARMQELEASMPRPAVAAKSQVKP